MTAPTDDDVIGYLSDHEWNLLLADKDYAVLKSLMSIRGMTEAEALNIIHAVRSRLKGVR